MMHTTLSANYIHVHVLYMPLLFIPPFIQRYKYYIMNCVGNEDIEPMPSNQMNQFFNRVSPALVTNPNYTWICKLLEEEILKDYQFSLKKAIVDYILIDPEEKKRLNIGALPLPSTQRYIHIPFLLYHYFVCMY